MQENKYKARLIKRLERTFPGCVILKLDPEFMQGVPDLLILYKNMWGMLEVKIDADAPMRPNQEYYIDVFEAMSFASFIHPGNEEEVIHALQHAFESCWDPCFVERQ